MAHEHRAEAANAKRLCAEGQELISARQQYAQEYQGLQQQAAWATQEAYKAFALE